MNSIVAHNITSPLGMTSEQNYEAVASGRSALCCYEHRWGLPESFTASLFAEAPAVEGHTRFESMVITSVRAAVAQTDIDMASPRTVLVISTTKGNVEMLADERTAADEREYPGQAALAIGRALGMSTTPIVVCNACISGVAAIILADRLLSAGLYDTAIVSGADSQSPFIVSGFQSFKALSATPCRPFDAERDGLNLGEAAATICLSSRQAGRWHVAAGAVRNDANHISGPSRTGEGSFRALRQVLGGDEVDFVNVHGTATLYNDEMESIALERAGLTATPVNALKGYYGHTMGAAGILETIVSMLAADNRTLPATRGYTNKGVSGNIVINNRNTSVAGGSFVKLLSGFGGCNAAIRMTAEDKADRKAAIVATDGVVVADTTLSKTDCVLTPLHRVVITPNGISVDGKALPTTATGAAMLTEVYRSQRMAYPKFFKMDLLSRLGFIASELLLGTEGTDRLTDRESRAVILFNRSSSIVADRQHQALIADADNFFPSPSVFVYTLPNIVTGEIAIRNRYHGETSLYILPRRDDTLMDGIYRASLLDPVTTSIIGGWIDCTGDSGFEADLTLFCKE